MTKKDYKAIAEIINKRKHTRNDYELIPSIIDVQSLIDDLSSYFKQDNINFDKQRFIDACLK